MLKLFIHFNGFCVLFINGFFHDGMVKPCIIINQREKSFSKDRHFLILEIYLKIYIYLFAFSLLFYPVKYIRVIVAYIYY